ncbi:hypothetical protein [Endozoicomonas sp. GU-1]|uniref:hypothetical protein n=1 Tax=Endozoicomonas sp. GU-1 TaxID=3009078 RepID=UPI0022B37576|nr:hypothetical protein [Endozoicomonas sp. GU-1]WBA88060.1 hypothetical protein O3276_08675 [Endozoicomonas sp. GU-1]
MGHWPDIILTYVKHDVGPIKKDNTQVEKMISNLPHRPIIDLEWQVLLKPIEARMTVCDFLSHGFL